jgi:hypothetical protein
MNSATRSVKGEPFQLDAVFLLEFEQPLVGDEGVGALVVGVDAYARLFHRGLSGRQIIGVKHLAPGFSGTG